jgi:hypothetical protein
MPLPPFILDGSGGPQPSKWTEAVMYTTTLAEPKKAKACAPSYRCLCKQLGGYRKYGKSTPLAYTRILELNGLNDCLWALAHGDEAALYVCRLAALVFAQRAERYTDDERVRNCNRVTHLYLHGEATCEELSAAQTATLAASVSGRAASAARHAALAARAARYAALAARAARYAAQSAGHAVCAAGHAASDPIWTNAGYATGHAVCAAGHAASYSAESQEQITILRDLLKQCESEESI